MDKNEWDLSITQGLIEQVDRMMFDQWVRTARDEEMGEELIRVVQEEFKLYGDKREELRQRVGGDLTEQMIWDALPDNLWAKIKRKSFELMFGKTTRFPDRIIEGSLNFLGLKNQAMEWSFKRARRRVKKILEEKS